MPSKKDSAQLLFNFEDNKSSIRIIEEVQRSSNFAFSEALNSKIKFTVCISKLLQLANYLERNLFPLRLLCYTQYELLNVPHGEKIEFNSCLRQFFLLSAQKDNKCLHEDPVRVLIIPRISRYIDRVSVIRSAPSAHEYRNYIRKHGNPIWSQIFLSFLSLVLMMNRLKGATLRGKVSRGYPRLFLSSLLWYVPYEMYPKLCYPPFVQGSGLIITREAAQRIVSNICSFPRFNLDDVFMGILASCLSINMEHVDGFDDYDSNSFIIFHYQWSRYPVTQLNFLYKKTVGHS
ncbi:Hexosyltransferase [Dirofilaria immitis]|nr:Hexosyltransferase [Dirofilaria immitis]